MITSSIRKNPKIIPNTGIKYATWVWNTNPFTVNILNLINQAKPVATTPRYNNDNVDSWLKTQPNPSEVFTQYDYDFIKKQLQNYLNPGSDDTTDSTNSKPESSSQTSDITLETATAGNQTKVEKFDDLFNE